MTELPSGTVTFLFTDVEGSTRLLHEHGERYADLLAAHRRLLREAFGRHGGVEVDAQGDAFFFAFARASDALAAAQEGRRALEPTPVHVRMGVHTGEPTVTDEGYVGVDVHKAARIAAAGHGGQVLVSDETARLAGPEGLRDLGEHRLKDLTAPERIYQLGDGDFAPLKTLYGSNLPLAANPLVGRKKELADALRLLTVEGTRVLSVTGPGGIGKTRFALAVAAEATQGFADGTWFVDLTPLRDPGLVLGAIGQTLGAEGDLARHLADSECLLLLDNFEQVVGAAAEVASLLAACPRLRLLVTSREPLRIAAEREYALRPLPESPAVELLRQRAGAVVPEVEIEYALGAELCRRLDGLPLAIELAAARVKVFAPEDLLARLEQRLPLLVSRARDVPERQRTLHSTIAWSYELLTEPEQELFRRLAVFAGGATLEAIEAVAGGDAELVESLVDKSLLRRQGVRFSMLETIREFAAERLEESGVLAELARSHAAYFVEFARDAEPKLTGPQQAVWLERIGAEHENLRDALERLLNDDEPEAALHLAGALVFFWYVRGFYDEGTAWLERALERSPRAASRPRASALWGAGLLAALAGDSQKATRLAREALSIARGISDDSLVARSLDVLGLFAFFENDVRRARTLLEESVEAARRSGDEWCLADALGTLGSIYPLQGDFDAAESAGARGLEIARRRGDQQGVRIALFGLALTASRRGDVRRARSLAEEGAAICREMDDAWFTSYFLWLLAIAACGLDEIAVARREAKEALELARETDAPLLLTCALEASARVARADGDDGAAQRHLEDALDLAALGGVPKSYLATVRLLLGEVARARGNADEARAHFEAALEAAEDVDDRLTADRARDALIEAGR